MQQRQRALVLAGALALTVAALVAPRAHTAEALLIGTSGPGFDLSITDAAGATVTRLQPGTYEIEVRDLSSEHNFHLFGPGVDRTTDLGRRSTETWTVTLATGRYRAICDPHSTMVADLVVGDPPPGEPPPAPLVAPVPLAGVAGSAPPPVGGPASAAKAAAAKAAAAKAAAAKAAALRAAAAKAAAARAAAAKAKAAAKTATRPAKPGTAAARR